MNQKWRMKMKKNIFLTIILLTASGLNAAAPQNDPTMFKMPTSDSRPTQKILPGVPTPPTTPMTNANGKPQALSSDVLTQMTATAKTNAAVHKPDPAVTKAATNLAQQAHTIAKTTVGHLKAQGMNAIAQAKAMGTQAQSAAQTVLKQAKGLKATADQSGLTSHVQEIGSHIQNAYQFAQTPAVRSALVDYGAGQQQIAAAGGLATAAGQSVHASFQQHMQAQHGPTVQQAIQHMQFIKSSINGFLTREMFAAALSANSNQGQAALNVLDALNDVVGPISDYINSGQAQAMINQMKAAMDASK